MKFLIRNKIQLFAYVCFLLWLSPAIAQPADSSGSVIVREISITGNKKTKSRIIIRELPFRKGDTIETGRINELIDIARRNIYNTELFTSVDIHDQCDETRFMDVEIVVRERWYIIPFPYVELADRSFNVWAQKYHGDLRRLSYGADLKVQNLNGLNDNLEVLATAGFNRRISVNYVTPFLSAGMKSRMKFGFSTLASREIPYMTTEDNKLLYYQSRRTIRNNFRADGGFILRKGIKKREWLTLSMYKIALFDSIGIINPDYFRGTLTHFVFPEIEYRMKYDDADNIMYPIEGKKYELTLAKRGLEWDGGLNRLFASGFAGFYRPLGGRWFGTLKLRGQIMVPFDQPYFNTRMIGYDNHYIRGYEFYVMDGVASFIAKVDIKRKLFHFDIPTYINSNSYYKIPLTVYAKVYGDAGAAYSKNRSLLGNKMQYGGGIGIDIVTIHDIALSLNFSINTLGEPGVFLHRE